ncbi:MAG: iron-containing alcohol dehydrogenase [Lachnospiraceae bacterium]|nr:iron-containing alcohol dehydrogenase [Lachnospiraceae bacterium]
MNFEYFTPTKVVFGKGTESKVGELIREQGGHKVLIHYGGGSVVRSGLLDKVCESLKNAGLPFVTLGGVVPNPRLSKVREGIQLCRGENVDFLLAVGGGSVIDSTKAILYGLANEGDVWDLYDYKRQPTACAPIGAVLTIAAAGSEMSDSSVITNEDGWIKRGYSSNYCRCRFAVMDPELTSTLPDYQTQSGCVDIMMHTMERYFHRDGGMELTDGIAVALIRTVMKNAKILKENPSDYDARAEVMWASSLSHNGLTGCGTDGGDWASHQIEHELGGMFDVAHGAGLAAVWGSWARYVYQECPERFASFAREVFGLSESNVDGQTAASPAAGGAGAKMAPLPVAEDGSVKTSAEDTGTDSAIDFLALAGIEAMEDFYRSVGMPTSLKELGIAPTEEQILEMADKCSIHGHRTVGVIKKLDAEDVAQIYRMARE